MERDTSGLNFLAEQYQKALPPIGRPDDALCSPERMFNLWQWARSTRFLEGEMAEVGVYRGRSSVLIARANPSKQLHAFDTFTGMPPMLHEKDDAPDPIKVGDFNDLGDALDLLEAEPNITIHSGVFPGTAVSLHRKKFCFAHFDGDIYNTCKEFLSFFFPRMVTGGVLIFDDYGWEKTPGVEQALSEFLSDKEDNLIQIAKCQALIVKI